MKNFEELEKKLKETKRQTNPQSDERILETALSEFQRSRKVSQSIYYIGPVVKTAAAVFILALITGIVLLFSSGKKDTPPQFAEEPIQKQEQTVQPEREKQIEIAYDKEQKEFTEKVKRDLGKVAAFIQAEDANGLLAILEGIELPAQMLAANYLSQYGDLQTAEALDILSDKHFPDEPNNIFAAATSAIMTRFKQKETEPEPAPGEDARYEFKPKGILSGLITDAQTGEPIENVTVRISIRRSKQTKTDANGFYSLGEIERDGNYRISIHSKEYVGITDYDRTPVINLSSNKQTVRHFQIDRACMIEVGIIDEQGQPVEKARVWASSLADEHGREVGDSFYARSTDTNGLITLGGFEPSQTPFLITATRFGATYLIKENRKRYRKKLPDLAPGHLKVKLTDADIIEYGEIVLKKGVDVKGYAEYSDGVPAEGLRISAYPQWWRSTIRPQGYEIDPNGNFTLKHIVPSYYRLQVSIPRGGGSSTGVPLYQIQLPPENNDLLVVTIPQKSPQSLVSISGKITFVGPQKPSYVNIDAWSSQCSSGCSLGHGPKGIVDSNFTVGRLEPGKYRLTFSGDNLEQKIIEGVEAPSEDFEVELVYNVKPKLYGHVIDANSGKAITEFKARARKLTTLRSSYYVQRDRWTYFKDTEGKFQIEAVGPGIYQVQISTDNYAPSWSNEINTDINEPVVVELIPGGRIKGKVINENGQPVKDAIVIPLSKAGGNMPRVKDVFVSDAGATVTDANGQFLLENLPPGSETLKAVYQGYTFAIKKDINVENGQTTEGIEMVLSKGGTVEGYVYDEEGKPQPNVTLYFQDDVGYGGVGDEKAGRLATATTDANGYYQVSGLPEKICYVDRQRQWESLGVVRRATVPENGKVFHLDFGGKPIVKGQLVIDGQPIANRRVVMAGTDSPHFGLFKCLDATDNNGRFTFRAGVRGKYAVYYESQTRRSNWIKIETVTLSGSDIDLGQVPEKLSQINVAIVMHTEDPNLTIQRLSLQEGADYWGQQTGQIDKPNDPSKPYKISGVKPGVYTIVAERNDQKIIMQTVDVTDSVQNVNLVIPVGTASISGRFLGKDSHWLFLWRQDKRTAAYLRSGKNKVYEVTNLPAGRYFAGGNKMVEEGAIAEFELAEGEHKVIDIDTSNLLRVNRGVIIIMPVDENGIIITDAEVWLSGVAERVDSNVNQRGSYYFRAEPGQYEAHVNYTGYQQIKKKVVIDPVPEDTTSYKHKIEIIRLQKK